MVLHVRGSHKRVRVEARETVCTGHDGMLRMGQVAWGLPIYATCRQRTPPACSRPNELFQFPVLGHLTTLLTDQPQWQLQFLRSCPCNASVAIQQRFLSQRGAPLPQPNRRVFTRVRRLYLELARFFAARGRHAPLTSEEFIIRKKRGIEVIAQTMRDQKLKCNKGNTQKYINARTMWLTMECRHVTEWDEGASNTLLPQPGDLKKFCVLDSFAKGECLKREPLHGQTRGDDFGKPPRPINPRGVEANIVVGQFTVPIEGFVYNHLDAEELAQSPRLRTALRGSWGRIIAKGLNSLARGELLMRKREAFRAKFGVWPMMVKLDATGWDAHVCAALCEVEWAFFAACYPEHAAYIRSIKQFFITNRGNIKGYMLFKRKGGRASGDMHTALGNCLSMIMLLLDAMQTLGLGGRYDVMNDGDDCILFIEPRQLPAVLAGLPHCFQVFGHELRIEEYSEDPYAISFCQSRLIPMQWPDGRPAWKWVQSPFKMAATIGSHVHMRTKESAEAYLSAVFHAYSVLNHGIPVLGEIDVLSRGPSDLFHLDVNSSIVRSLSKEVEMPIATMETLQRFWEAYLPPADCDAIMADWRSAPRDWIKVATTPTNLHGQ